MKGSREVLSIHKILRLGMFGRSSQYGCMASPTGPNAHPDTLHFIGYSCSKVTLRDALRKYKPVSDADVIQIVTQIHIFIWLISSRMRRNAQF